LNPGLNRIARRFDRADGSYDSHALAQTSLADALIGLYRRDAPAHKILEMGCGTGLFTRRLLARFPGSSLWVTDASPRMLATAETRLSAPGAAGNARLHFRLLDAQCPAWPADEPGGPFDLVASNALAQWFPDIESHIRGCAALLRRGGSLLIGAFLDDNLKELRASLEAISARPLKTGHGVEEIQTAGENAGLVLKGWRGLDERLEYADTAAFLGALAALGATGGPSTAPLSGADLRRLKRTYQERYRYGNGVAATWSAYAAWWIKP